MDITKGITLSAPSPAVPKSLEVPDGHTLLLVSKGVGDQIYNCRTNPNQAGKTEWTLTAPDAVLQDAYAEQIGTHFGGPTWLANDGSKVVGTLKERVAAPDANAIPWLLLTAKSEGTGILGNVTFIQRLHTKGGKAPATGCDEAHVGSEVRVSYEADYYFYGPEGGSSESA